MALLRAGCACVLTRAIRAGQGLGLPSAEAGAEATLRAAEEAWAEGAAA